MTDVLLQNTTRTCAEQSNLSIELDLATHMEQHAQKQLEHASAEFNFWLQQLETAQVCLRELESQVPA